MLEKRMQEIKERKLEIRGLLQSDEAVEFEVIEKELQELEIEERGITKKMEVASKINVNEEEVRQIKKPVEKREDVVKMETNKFGTMEYREAFMKHVVTGEKLPQEFRANANTKTTDVGSVIPETVMNKIVEKLEATGMILPLVTRTSYKGGVAIPTSNVKPVATWVAEGATSDKQKKTTGEITFTYHKLRCAVSVSLETDVMSLSAFESQLINNITEAMVKAIEQSIISGTGVGQPKGILTETPVEGQAIDASACDFDTLVKAEAALPQEYENGARWCMTKKTFMTFVGMTDAQGQPIARVDYGIAGKPERTLLGRPVVICNYLDSFATGLAAGKVFAFLFNFNDYALNTNYSMGIKTYEDNETEDIVRKSVMIVDGKVVVKDSLVTVKKSA